NVALHHAVVPRVGVQQRRIHSNSKHLASKRVCDVRAIAFAVTFGALTVSFMVVNGLFQPSLRRGFEKSVRIKEAFSGQSELAGALKWRRLGVKSIHSQIIRDI